MVFGFGLPRLKLCTGEVVLADGLLLVVVVIVVAGGLYAVLLLMAGARRVLLVGEMPNSFAFGDWWAAGGGERPASVVSIVMGTLFAMPLFFAT